MKPIKPSLTPLNNLMESLIKLTKANEKMPKSMDMVIALSFFTKPIRMTIRIAIGYFTLAKLATLDAILSTSEIQ